MVIPDASELEGACNEIATGSFIKDSYVLLWSAAEFHRNIVKKWAMALGESLAASPNLPRLDW